MTTQDNWIATAERLPKEEDAPHHLMVIALYRNSTKTQFTPWYAVGSPNCPYSHWLPVQKLPDPPKPREKTKTTKDREEFESFGFTHESACYVWKKALAYDRKLIREIWERELPSLSTILLNETRVRSYAIACSNFLRALDALIKEEGK